MNVSHGQTFETFSPTNYCKKLNETDHKWKVDKVIVICGGETSEDDGSPPWPGVRALLGSALLGVSQSQHDFLDFTAWLPASPLDF